MAPVVVRELRKSAAMVYAFAQVAAMITMMIERY
jgi:hypothetical protein